MISFESYTTILLTAIAVMMLIFTVYAYRTYWIARDIMGLAGDKIQRGKEVVGKTIPSIFSNIADRLAKHR